MVRNQKGQSLIEYVILVALVALVSIGAAKALGTKISAKIKAITEQVDGIKTNQNPS